MHDRTPLRDRANGRWREILPQFGVDLRTLDGKHHACPLCGGKDRWRFDDKEGNGTSICGQCGSRNGITLVMAMKGLDFSAAAIEIEKIIGTEFVPPQPTRPKPDRAAAIQRVIREITKMTVRSTLDDPVDRYLRDRVPGLRFVPPALRYAERLEYVDDDKVITRHAGMVAIVGDAHGDAIAIHRTYLTPDGRKAMVAEPRKSLGPLPDGCAVRLAKITGKTVGIAEGIETALSAMALHRIPVWAALNAGRLEAWSPPEGIDQVVVFGDNDANNTGQAAAYNLAKRLEASKVATQVMIPPDVGTDWNDVHRNRGQETT